MLGAEIEYRVAEPVHVNDRDPAGDSGGERDLGTGRGSQPGMGRPHALGLDSTEQHRTGRIVEFDETEKIFTNPSDQRTEDYVTGKVG